MNASCCGLMSAYASTSRSVLYHCPCVSSSPLPPTSASGLYSFHPIDSLYFCEECDAVRCPDCITSEVSSYYCPNCLFDVPTANVRAEKNRNCFQCPACFHSLSVLASDNTVQNVPPTAAEASIGVPPYFLHCSSCKWTSSEIGMQFDKPTGLAHQLQKIEDQAADLLEFDNLKSHFDTYLAKTASITTPKPTATKAKAKPSQHISTITAAASHALHREIPGLAKAKARARPSMAVSPAKRMTVSDEMDDYKVLSDWRGVGLTDGLPDDQRLGEGDKLALLKTLQLGDQVASLENTLDQSWAHSSAAFIQAPKRIPLLTKPTKRCPDCRHILIQPESKAASVRYKIKLVASNYLPLVELGNRRLRGRGSGSKVEPLDEGLEPGRGYLFQIAFTNPLYDPITVRLALARPSSGAQVHLPTTSFPISALKDAWAYDGEEDDDPGAAVFDGNSAGTLGRTAGSRMSMGGARKAAVERKENVTKVGLEVLLPHDYKEQRLEFDMQVAYTYRSDDSAEKTDSAKVAGPEEYKTFTYWVRVDVGEVFAPLDPQDDVQA